MGLDMYLTGERYFHGSPCDGSYQKKTEGYDLGYWRKHPNLHGYIVQNFADGVDECQQIDLGADSIAQIIGAIEKGELPQTDGFFFGASASGGGEDGILHYMHKYGVPREEAEAEAKREKEEDLSVWRKALEWLEAEDKEAWRSINYRASW